MSNKTENINQILENLSKLPLDRIVTWILNNIEFDKIIKCINDTFKERDKNLDMFDKDTLVSNIVVPTGSNEEYQFVDWYFEPDSKEDILLNIIEKTRNKIFAPISIKSYPSSTGNKLLKPTYKITCMYNTGQTFEINYSELFHILKYIDLVPENVGEPIDSNEITVSPNVVPIVLGSLWSQPKIFQENRGGTLFQDQQFWDHLEKLEPNESLSNPRLLRSTGDKLAARRTETMSFYLDPVHIPGEFGSDSQTIPREYRKGLETIMECRHKAFGNIPNSGVGFGNIQKAAAEKDIYITNYSFGKKKFHIYNFKNDWDRDRYGNVKGKWVSKTQLLNLAKSKGKGTLSKKGFTNFMNGFGQCAIVNQPLGQDLQTRPVSPHRFGYYKRIQNKFGSSHRKKKSSCFGSVPNRYGIVKSSWGGSHGGFPKVKYGYRSTQGTYGGTTGVVGAPTIQNYILNQ